MKTFDQFLSAVIEYTEDRPLVLRRQSELLSLYTHASRVPFAATFIREVDEREKQRKEHK